MTHPEACHLLIIAGKLRELGQAGVTLAVALELLIRENINNDKEKVK